MPRAHRATTDRRASLPKLHSEQDSQGSIYFTDKREDKKKVSMVLAKPYTRKRNSRKRFEKCSICKRNEEEWQWLRL